MKKNNNRDSFEDDILSGENEKYIRACEMCGTTRGKIVKIKYKGSKQFLCEYCFDSVRED